MVYIIRRKIKKNQSLDKKKDARTAICSKFLPSHLVLYRFIARDENLLKITYTLLTSLSMKYLYSKN